MGTNQRRILKKDPVSFSELFVATYQTNGVITEKTSVWPLDCSLTLSLQTPIKLHLIGKLVDLCKVKLSLYRPWRPLGCERLRLPHFQIFGSQMAARLSVLRAGRPLHPGRFLILISVRGWVDPRTIVRLEGLGQLKKSTSSRTRTGDLPACSYRYRMPPRRPLYHG
jgi:hypothetical protein